MKLDDYRIPRPIFEALSSGGGGPAAIRMLAAAECGKHAVLLWGVRDAVRVAGNNRDARMALSGYDLLCKVQRHDPVSASTAIRYPAVGAWALHAVRASRGAAAMPGVELAQLSAVAAVAAIRAKLPVEIEVPVSRSAAIPDGEGMVVLPSLGVASAPGKTATVRVGVGETSVWSAGRQVRVPTDPYQDAPGWRGLHRLRTGSLDVLIDDLDPLRMPAMANVAPRLSAAETANWDTTLQQGWELIEQQHPLVAAEVAEAITVLVPLISPGELYASSSSPEVFGAVAMSEPPDRYECAVTLVHEAQHLKLCALSDVVVLTRPDDGRRFYAPWRPDPRPVSGLLQGVYAHLGVTRFWRQQRHVASGAVWLNAHTEFARWRAAAALVTHTLRSSGQLTAAGLDFVDGMSLKLSEWQEESVPTEAQLRADRAAELHLARWKAANGPYLA